MIRTFFKKLLPADAAKMESRPGDQPDGSCLELQPIALKREAAGRFSINACGTLPFKLVAVQCLLRACSIKVRFDEEEFSKLMRQQSMPEYLIKSYLESVTITDETNINNPPVV